MLTQLLLVLLVLAVAGWIPASNQLLVSSDHFVREVASTEA